MKAAISTKGGSSAVFQFAKRNNPPIITAMGGGYSKDIKIILNAHANTFKVAFDVFDY